MTKSTRLLACLLTALLYISNGYGSADAQTTMATPQADNHASFQPIPPKAQPIHAAPGGAVLVAPVTLTPDKPAWVTAEGATGEALPGVSVVVNGDLVDTNARGQAVFRAPNQAAVNLYLKADDGQEIARLEYALAANGLLCRPAALQTARRLVPSKHGASCQLLYTPAVMQPGQTAVVVGTGFSGQPGTDKVIVDGANAEVLAGSESSLIAKVPDHLAVGAMKPFFVSTVSGDTETFEVDLATPQMEWTGNILAKQTDMDGRLSLLGTSLPAVVRIVNDTADDLILSTAGANGTPLGADALMIMPGGDENFQNVKATHASRRRPSLHFSLVPDAPELVDAPAGDTAKCHDPAVWQTLDYALLVKLKRRCLAVENSIWQNRLLARSQSAAQLDKQLAQERALCQRHIALAAMIRAREAIFAAHGGTASQLAQAVDDATGGAYYVLESQVRALYVVPESPVIKEPPAVAPLKVHIFEQLPEPKFKLWPPIEGTTHGTQPMQTSTGSSNQVVAAPNK